MTVKAIAGTRTFVTPGTAAAGGEAVGAKVYVTGQPTFAAAHEGAILFDTVLYDSDGFAANPYRLQVLDADLAGLYHVNYAVQWGIGTLPTAGQLLVNLRVAIGSGTEAIVLQPSVGFTRAAQTGYDWVSSFSGAVDLQLLYGDYVLVEVLNELNQTVTVNGGLLSGLWPATWLAWQRIGDAVAGSTRG